MSRCGKWETIRQLGTGGQGVVHLAKDTKKLGVTETRLADIRKAIGSLAGGGTTESQRRMGQLLVEAISCLSPKDIDPAALGALKVLHEPRELQGYEKAEERMKREVEALSQIAHPNILKILDHNLDQRWFVGEYHIRGPLSDHQALFKGDILTALKAFQPLVEGVATLHKKGIVHRDIKPQNVFLSTERKLVLGDMGIVFFTDDLCTRVTDSYENVGSRDWMPQWAMGMRIEDIRPTFDVFCLGKLFWAMLSGRSFLRLWYHHRDEFELEKLFPGDESIQWARRILDKCVVENEENCLEDAGKLLIHVNNVNQAVKRHAQVVAEGVSRRCEVCGSGQYRSIANEDQSAIRNFGLEPTGSSTFKIFTCSHCGHVQMFSIADPPKRPRAWSVKS